MKRKTILIIGAGVSGLTSGIYAEQNGLHAVIYEKNHNPGGLCNGWDRKGHYVDGCIHWLTGTKKGDTIREMWDNVGAIESDSSIISLDSFGTVVHQGTKVTFWADLDRTEREWLELSKEDSRAIKRLFRYARNIADMELPLDCPISLMPLTSLFMTGIRMFPHLWTLFVTKNHSKESYAKKFKNPSLRYALHHAQAGENNLFSFLYTYGTVSKGNAGIPIGGSRPMVERMAQKFMDLGGTIHYSAPVREVTVSDDKATGIVLENGTEVEADYVISACDAIYTHKVLLGGKYQGNDFMKMKDQPVRFPTPSCVHLSFLVKGDIGSVPTPITFETIPFLVGNKVIRHLTARSFSYDPRTYCHDGTTMASVLIDQYADDFEYWDSLRSKNRSTYEGEKREIADQVIERLEMEFPSLKGNIQLIDCFTPATLARYTNATDGAYMPFMYLSHGKMLFHNGKVKGLKNLFIASQWIQSPGGLPLALASGKFAIQRICKQEEMIYLFPKRKNLRYNH